MKDRRTVDELSIQELEEVLRLRKRQERLRRLRRQEGPIDAARLSFSEPPETEASAPASANQPSFDNIGATATYRAREVPEDVDEEDASPWWARINVDWSWLQEKGLLVVEMGVLSALILVLITSMANLRKVNQTSSAAQTIHTMSPTPPIHVVLPGGHTPPDAPGGPAPAEIPAHLQDLVSAVTPLPVPTPGPEQATRIQVSSIDVDVPVMEGDDWETLKRGAGHLIGSANPGERGNCVISAHNDIFGQAFRDLPDVGLGDEVIVHTASRAYRYVVSQKRIIKPTEVDVLNPTSSPILTLISCYPYGIDTHRIAVVAEMNP